MDTAMDAIVERWVQCLLLWLKSRSVREISRHVAFKDNCLIVTRLTSLVVDEFLLLFLVYLDVGHI